MAGVSAWLLSFGAARRAVIGESQFVQLLQEPYYHQVPHMPAHRRHMCVWENRLISVWDMMRWFGLDTAPAPLAAVARYTDAGGYRYGALAVMAPPQRIAVRDADACPLPPVPPDWRRISLSCFSHEGDATPVLDLRRMFEVGDTPG